MERIAELNDKMLLGKDAWTNATPPRYTARAILQRQDGRYAVLYLPQWGLYSLPGGGMQAGETPEQALRREVMEETGCLCDSIAELGEIYENRAHADFAQVSYYYVVSTKGAVSAPRLTKKEKSFGTELQWHTLEQTLTLIQGFRPKTGQQTFLRARDLAALEAYRRKKSDFD